jgi:hypothetical protein
MAYTNLTGFVAGQLADALPDTAAGQAARHLASVIEGLRWPVLFGVLQRGSAAAVWP